MLKSKLLFCLSILIGNSVCAQTIDELSEMSRKTILAEGNAKITAAMGNVDGSRSPTVPPIMPMGAIGSNAANLAQGKGADSSKKTVPLPLILAIYGVADNLTAEINENGFEAKYIEGNVTPGGWVVKKIAKRGVILEKEIGKSKGKTKINLTYGQRKEEKENQTKKEINQ